MITSVNEVHYSLLADAGVGSCDHHHLAVHSSITETYTALEKLPENRRLLLQQRYYSILSLALRLHGKQTMFIPYILTILSRDLPPEGLDIASG